MFFSEEIKGRVHPFEKKLIARAVKEDDELESESHFLRQAAIRDLRRRYPEEYAVRNLQGVKDEG